MKQEDFQRYIGTFCEFKIRDEGKVKGIVVRGEKAFKEEYFLVKAADVIDYKVAYLQNDASVLEKLQAKIDVTKISRVKLSDDLDALH